MKHLPNAITCCNLICGCIATGFALQPDYGTALAFIIAGAVFDFFDGFTARLLKVSSPVGKELDSLADDITFGFAPAAVVFSLLGETTAGAFGPYLAYAAFLIAAFSALRLAKFNLDPRQSTTFIGLPTPANALFWAALATGMHDQMAQLPYAPALLLAGIALSCWLLVCEIPMFALKFKNYGWRGNEIRYGFILVSGALLGLLGWTGFSLIIVLYVIVSVFTNKCKS